MNDTIQAQLRLWCMKQKIYIHTPQQSRVFALPNGEVTGDREYARQQWEVYQLQKNAVKCHVSGKNKYCAGRL